MSFLLKKTTDLPSSAELPLDHQRRLVLSTLCDNPFVISSYARQGENAGYGIDKIMRWKDLTGQDVHFESDILASTLINYLPIRGGQINGLKNSEDHDYQSLKNGQGGQKRWSETRRGDEKSDCGSYATEP